MASFDFLKESCHQGFMQTIATKEGKQDTKARQTVLPIREQGSDLQDLSRRIAEVRSACVRGGRVVRGADL